MYRSAEESHHAMTVLSRPRHPIVADALHLARTWSAAHRIAGRPALTHAVTVAEELARHLPDPAPELIAAVLLHDSPTYAPPDLDLDTVLTLRLGPAVAHVVRGVHREPRTTDTGRPDRLEMPIPERWIRYTVAADTIVTVRATLYRANRSPDRAAYWQTHNAFLARLPALAAFATAAPHLPAGMTHDLTRLIQQAHQVTARVPAPGGDAR
jgi:hypothetical protein